MVFDTINIMHLCIDKSSDHFLVGKYFQFFFTFLTRFCGISVCLKVCVSLQSKKRGSATFPIV